LFALNLCRKIFSWLEYLANSAGIQLSRKKIGSGACLKNLAWQLAVAAEGSMILTWSTQT